MCPTSCVLQITSLIGFFITLLLLPCIAAHFVRNKIVILCLLSYILTFSPTAPPHLMVLGVRPRFFKIDFFVFETKLRIEPKRFHSVLKLIGLKAFVLFPNFFETFEKLCFSSKYPRQNKTFLFCS